MRSTIPVVSGTPDVLVSTAWVAEHAMDPLVRVVEVDVDTTAYEQGHVAGAVGWNWTTQLCDRVIRDIIPAHDLEELMARSGITRGTTIVLYGDNNNWFAAWAFWQLELYGHPDLRIMNGGRKKWLEEGRPLTKDAPVVRAAGYSAKAPDLGLRAMRLEVESALGQADVALVDVRSPQEFSGEILAPPGLPESCQRGGHIPGAVNIPWGRACNDDGTFRAPNELRTLYQAVGVTPDKTVITYCRIGERSAHSWFVLRHLLGYPTVRNYDGSWTEWGNMIAAPVARAVAVCLTALLLVAGCHSDVAGVTQSADDYEVWLADQSDTKGRTFGGTLYIYAGADLASAQPASAQPRDRIDLSNETAALCLSATGANPVRPHMLLFNKEHTHAILSFVASGHVVIFDAVSRKPLRCIRASRSATGQQAHAAYPAPDGSFIVVANQNGKRLERIDVNFATNSFTHNEAATLDLATCVTPNGAPCQSEALRPDNAPICPVVDGASRYAFVTLRGGGLLVVDVRQTPMRIVGEYDKATVKGNGCGGVEVAGSMYLNSGGRPGNLAHLNLYGFDVYRFPLGGYASANQLNSPAPTRVYSIEGARDSHGMVARGSDYIWVMDRHANVAVVISVASGAPVNTVSLAGALSDDPAPDLVDIAPSGNRLFVAFRGPTPLSGDPHIATGKTPGLGIIELSDGGRAGTLQAIVRVTNVDDGGVERADVHAVRVRRVQR